MIEYEVRWVIQVSADSPEEAARTAMGYQQDPSSIAHVYDVSEYGDGASDTVWTFDLDEPCVI